jgi:hypothetical protein
VNGKKAKYTIMIPQATGLSDFAHQRVVEGGLPIDHCYLDRDKLAHWPGGQPEPHDHLVMHANDLPEMDSHVKQLAREIGRQGGLEAVFAVKEGAKGPMSWVVDNPARKRQAADMPVRPRFVTVDGRKLFVDGYGARHDMASMSPQGRASLQQQYPHLDFGVGAADQRLPIKHYVDDEGNAQTDLQSVERLNPHDPHDCFENAIEYEYPGGLGHGWKCGVCGTPLQSG